MELVAAPSISARLSVLPKTPFISSNSFSLLPTSNSISTNNNHHQIIIKRRRNNKFSPRIHPAAVTDLVSAAAAPPPPPAEITWQIIVGAIAGVTPFIVAGIEFGKRIVAQRRCTTCGGSGLVLRENDYFKCPGCGGFLPWQSWKRFFTG